MLDEILLWSHYADKHKGMRIGFEFPEPLNATCQLSEMSYQKNRVEADFSFEVQIEVLEAALYKSAATKSSAWKYEAEVRLFTKVEYCDPQEIKTGNLTVVEHFLAFDSKWVKSIDFGALCPNDEIQKVVNLAKADYPHVVCRKGNFHEIEYALTYEEI